jgi:hypothetical protein
VALQSSLSSWIREPPGPSHLISVTLLVLSNLPDSTNCRHSIAASKYMA